MSLGEPRKRKVEINSIEEAHQNEVQAQLSTLSQLRSQNLAIREQSEGAIKQGLVGAFETLHGVTIRVLQSDDASWSERVQGDLRAIQDAVENARVAAEEALRELSQKSTDMRGEKEKVRLLAMKHKTYLKSLECELPIVQRSENTFWKEATEAREALTLWNKQVARRKEELNNMSWFRRLITNTAEMKRQLKLKQATELHSQQEHDRTSWQYIYTRALRVRAAAVLVAERDRISLLEKAGKESREDEVALLDLQTALADVRRDVVMLETCVQSPRIEFGRLDSLKCVLQLLRSEHMAQVGVCADVRSAEEAITSACRGRLSDLEWEQVQRPYQYPVGNLADIGSAGAGAIDSVGKVDDVQMTCNCPDCLAVG